MKKLVIAVAVLSLGGIAYASCIGPFCWDERGASVYGVLNNDAGAGKPNRTRAQIQATIPNAKGQDVFCSDCTAFNGILGYTCTSTGTATSGAYMAVSSATAVSACF